MSSLFGSSIFSNFGAASTAAPASTAAGASTNTTAPSASMFNLSQTTQAQPPAATSVFGNTQNQSQQNQNPQAPQSTRNPAAPQTGTAGTSQTAYFDSLLERSKKRKDADEGQHSNFGELPSLHLGLGDISQRVRELGGAGGASRRGKPVDSKAYVSAHAAPE